MAAFDFHRFFSLVVNVSVQWLLELAQSSGRIYGAMIWFISVPNSNLLKAWNSFTNICLYLFPFLSVDSQTLERKDVIFQIKNDYFILSYFIFYPIHFTKQTRDGITSSTYKHLLSVFTILQFFLSEFRFIKLIIS